VSARRASDPVGFLVGEAACMVVGDHGGDNARYSI
jgi:hypothetical protein